MINIDFILSKGVIIGINITGHAGYGEPGKDIVCAAISSTSQMIVLGMQDLSVDFDFIDERDTTYFKLNEIDERVTFLFTTFEKFVIMLKREFTRYINITRTTSD